MRLFKTALLFCSFALCGCVAVIESNEMMKRTQALLNTDFQGTTIKDLEYAEGEYAEGEYAEGEYADEEYSGDEAADEAREPDEGSDEGGE